MNGGFLDQIIYQLFLFISGTADIDANYRYIAVVAVKTGDQSCMGSGTAAGAPPGASSGSRC